MRRYEFITVDVFTASRFGGNPLAVFPIAEGLTDDEMQKLATEFNLSETTFVLAPADGSNTARVRIFNPVSEMPFAGHPNVGTALVLDAIGGETKDEMCFEEIAGLVRVKISRDQGGLPVATIEAPEALSKSDGPSISDIAQCVSLSSSDFISSGHNPTLASVGHPFLIAEVKEEALARAAPNASVFQEVERKYQLGGRLSIHVYARASAHRLRARMFAPLINIPEDPATGSANAALGALLLSLKKEQNRQRWEVSQGAEMGRPSTIFVRSWQKEGKFYASVGGTCVPVLRGFVEL